MDLSLVETEKLVDELRKRHETIVLATLNTEDGGKPLMYTYWTPGNYLECIGLCSALDRDIKDAYIGFRVEVDQIDELDD